MAIHCQFRRRSGAAIWLLTPLLCLAFGSRASAQTPLSPEAEKKAEEVAVTDPALYAAAQAIGRAYFLRCLCFADSLNFGVNGRLIEGVKTKPVDWTLAAVDVTKVLRKGPETVELDGVRVAMRWNDDQHEFNRHQIKTEPVKIMISGASDGKDLQRALAEIFSVGIDHALEASMPSYWQHYFHPALPWPADVPGVIAPVGAKANGVEVTAPAVAKKGSISYTPEAGQDRVQGAVTLLMVVDTGGVARHIQVVQPLGYGLDAVAVDGAKRTVFQPPMVAGKPGAVAMYVKENFSVVTANF